MELKLYNTASRKKEVFTPLDPKNVRLYVCGPTVYDHAHIGNARPVIVFDVLFRLLRHLYGADCVRYVRNITDVDDKINARAKDEGIDIRVLTERTAKQFHDDIAALGVLLPTVEPRATDHIPQMIAMIGQLIAAGHAYPAEGHVLYDVGSKPDYGKLARRSLDEMIAGARVDVAPYKKNPMDFVLWKPSDAAQPGWDSPWGRGRPGWHIECSAMSECHLGKTFDIHGGGIDLVFPHHENEIAQSEGAHNGKPLAKIWMHNGFLQVEGEKMSKSLGNFVTIRELLTDWHGYGWPGEAIRFNLLRTHYRQPLDWTLEGLDESHKTLWDWYEEFEGVAPVEKLPASIQEALVDDLNTPKVIAELHGLKDPASRLAAIQFLGFSGNRERIKRADHALPSISGSANITLGELTLSATASVTRKPIAELVEDRNAARKAKNFKEADRIRGELLEQGIVLKDGPDGTTWELKR